MITRRCILGQMLLEPSELVNQILAYALAVGQKKYDILVHLFCVMTNHWHLQLTDVLGNLPRFLSFVHAMIAKCINVLRKRKGAIWEPCRTDCKEILDAVSFFSTAAYVVTNPVAAGLVERPEEWSGLVSTRFGQSWLIKRPGQYFAEDSELPDHHVGVEFASDASGKVGRGSPRATGQRR